ncbi:unnamed protein product, partial [Discosporangium mesarthrocarpum]
PNASSFTFNPSASTWTPGGFSAPSPVPVETPITTLAQGAAEDKVAASMAGLGVQDAAPVDGEGGDEEVDENDPLWKATLHAANGDRAKALKMLEDPDSLMADPEVATLISASAGEVDLELIEGYDEG